MALAPWCAGERWEFFQRNGKTIARVTGRNRCPPELLNDAGWLLRNDYEQQLSDAPWFEPNQPQAKREADWALRNPLQNGRLFKWGWADRNYEVEVTEGRVDQPMLVQRDDIGETGWQKCTLTEIDSDEKRTFSSFSGPNLLYYAGTQPSGFYGYKFVPRTWQFWTWFQT